ncbi:MAG TPA: tRNA 2-thiouridine(34) synthase MnmA [Dehalococcoidia bacterium]|nr:tRNA 2-thiouridine(34) synthase MnmA [Dehalococcoidia bacterium]
MSTRGKRVIVALSGGVDSSVAAAILKDKGYEVIGITMMLCDRDAEKIEPARRICQILDIPFSVLDLTVQFQDDVVDYFCQEYLQGRTPNPCIRCNQRIKFGSMLDRALELGADYIATGHYARIERINGNYRLLKAADPAKDQSYLLYTLGQRELSRLLLPLGRYRKQDICRIAQQMSLPVWEKPESQEICFIPDNDYRSFLAKRSLPQPGDIVDTDGNVIGKHSGIGFYTIGQRHGLGLASSEPLYVVVIDAAGNRLLVGTKVELLRDELYAGQVSFVNSDPQQQPVNVTVKIRYKAPEVRAVLHPQGQRARVVFEEPQQAVTPGQAVVFYEDDAVLGGGTIETDNHLQPDVAVT